MISRLSFTAAVFALLATATLALAANVGVNEPAARAEAAASAGKRVVVQLPRVEVVGKRMSAARG